MGTDAEEPLRQCNTPTRGTQLSESSAEKLKSDTQNTHSDDDRKPLQDGGITDETMLNYLINNPEFLQKFKALLGV